MKTRSTLMASLLIFLFVSCGVDTTDAGSVASEFVEAIVDADLGRAKSVTAVAKWDELEA